MRFPSTTPLSPIYLEEDAGAGSPICPPKKVVVAADAILDGVERTDGALEDGAGTPSGLTSSSSATPSSFFSDSSFRSFFQVFLAFDYGNFLILGRGLWSSFSSTAPRFALRRDPFPELLHRLK